MNVLSLFDGISCGQLALNRAGLPIDTYYASEVDKYAMQVTMANFPNTIQLGSVTDIDCTTLPKIDLLIGGSPCQSFSFAGKRKGMSTKNEQEVLTLDHYLQLKNEGYEFEGQSYLFWEYMRILTEIKPKYFLLENVLMSENWEKVITKAMGVHPIDINSSLVSAQNRRRFYWTNIGMKPMGFFSELESIILQPIEKGIYLNDILEKDVSKKYYLSDKMIKSFIDKTEKYNLRGGGYSFKPTNGINKKSRTVTNPSKNRIDDVYIYENKNIRRITPIEAERLQTIPDNYTNMLSDTQRYKCIGNGWTIDVIVHIFKHLPYE
jgi:DNA-cytosine methyltransferase